MSQKTKPIYKALLAVILICTFIVLYWLINITEGKYYRFHSPDGQYSVFASKNKYFNLNLPNSKFRDASGKIHLYDELENELVGSSSVEMISNCNELFWSEDELYSKAKIHIKLPRKIDARIINKNKKPNSTKDSWSLFIQGKRYKINKLSHRKLTVSNANGEYLLEDIKYISQINNGFQVLNENTKIEYYDAELNKLENRPSTEVKFNEVCGNVTTYGLKIEETKKYYIINKAIGFTDYIFNTYNAIDSVNKTKVKDIYFLNKKRELTYDENKIEEEFVIVDFGTYFGILTNLYGIEYFDLIDLSEAPIKVMRNKLYGYYNITPTKYSELEPFVYNLAEFKEVSTNGENRKGYIDREGNIYYE